MNRDTSHSQVLINGVIGIWEFREKPDPDKTSSQDLAAPLLCQPYFQAYEYQAAQDAPNQKNWENSNKGSVAQLIFLNILPYTNENSSAPGIAPPTNRDKFRNVRRKAGPAASAIRPTTAKPTMQRTRNMSGNIVQETLTSNVSRQSQKSGCPKSCETLVLYRKRASRRGCSGGRVLWRAFDKAV